MKNISFSFLLFLCLAIPFTSCKKNQPEPIVINANDFSVSFQNATQNNDVLGTVNASTNSGTLTYTFASQEATGALAINANTGQITVANRSVIYNFYCSNNYPPFFKTTVTISNGTISKTITVAVNMVGLICA